jgi:hypothetical protein
VCVPPANRADRSPAAPLLNPQPGVVLNVRFLNGPLNTYTPSAPVSVDDFRANNSNVCRGDRYEPPAPPDPEPEPDIDTWIEIAGFSYFALDTGGGFNGDAQFNDGSINLDIDADYISSAPISSIEGTLLIYYVGNIEGGAVGWQIIDNIAGSPVAGGPLGPTGFYEVDLDGITLTAGATAFTLRVTTSSGDANIFVSDFNAIP